MIFLPMADTRGGNSGMPDGKSHKIRPEIKKNDIEFYFLRIHIFYLFFKYFQILYFQHFEKKLGL